MSLIEDKSTADLELIYKSFQNHAEFARHSLIVETESKQLVPMVLSTGQIRLNDAIKKQRLKGVPVRLIYLKSRRIQATTAVAARFFQDTAFTPGTHCAVLAHDATSTENIFKIYKRFQALYRPFAGCIALPPSRVLAEQINYEYGGDPESSFILVKTAGSINFGRSFRLSAVHLSEAPYYERLADTLSAVMSAVPKTPDTTAVIEGTAKTIGDTFHRMWQAAMDPSSESEWVGLFMGWHEHRANAMPVHDVERFGNSITRDERELMGRFNLTFEQLCWRRFTIANDCVGDLIRFQREHPATPEEAFQASSRNRFSIPHIQRSPIQNSPLVGELVEDPIGIEKRLVFVPGDRGALRVWKNPERGRMYMLGCDCAQGLDIGGDGASDPDYSATQVIDRDNGEQVAVLHARLMPGQTGKYVARIARWYNMSQIVGEINPGGGGVSMLEAVLNEDYPASLLYHRAAQVDQDPQVRSDRLGWATTGASRPLLLGYLDEAIRQGSLVIRDALTVQELLTFVIGPNGKAEAQRGCHDDLVIALALAVVGILRMPRPVARELLRTPEVRRYGQPQGNPDARGRNTRVR